MSEKVLLVDTNILIDFVRDDGPHIRRILHAVEQGRVRFAVIPSVRREYELLATQLGPFPIPSAIETLELRLGADEERWIGSAQAYWGQHTLPHRRPGGSAKPESAPPTRTDLEVLIGPCVLPVVGGVVSNDLRIHDEYDILSANLRGRFGCFDAREFDRLVLRAGLEPDALGLACSERKRSRAHRGLAPSSAPRGVKGGRLSPKQAALQPRSHRGTIGPPPADFLSPQSRDRGLPEYPAPDLLSPPRVCGVRTKRGLLCFKAASPPDGRCHDHRLAPPVAAARGAIPCPQLVGGRPCGRDPKPGFVYCVDHVPDWRPAPRPPRRKPRTALVIPPAQSELGRAPATVEPPAAPVVETVTFTPEDWRGIAALALAVVAGIVVGSLTVWWLGLASGVALWVWLAAKWV